ncbi:MAG: ATP-binding cassette domain-containing protein [Lachnospiraceae bacterium]|jgi:zinc transport system ATP-binding protein|nr:ATP-binding cassette domain-containing protein [Lachnospiraceae bacterium]
MALLTCDNLAIGYEAKTIISNLSFTVERGDFLCIAGENGSGKSTLMKTILGLMTPLSGQIIFADGLKNHEIGYLPQQTAVQKDFPASVYEVVLSGCLGYSGLRPFYRNEEKNLAKDNMERLGISALRRCSYRELSGGQQQRVLLARALCAARTLLLLDEPAAGLDTAAAAVMYEHIKQLNSDGLTIIMISHDVEKAAEYASHILSLGTGKGLFFGTVAAYLQAERTIEGIRHE